MKYCKDCTYSTSVNGNDWYLSKLFCKFTATMDPVYGFYINLPGCEVARLGCKGKRYKRKWWKFWREK